MVQSRVLLELVEKLSTECSVPVKPFWLWLWIGTCVYEYALCGGVARCVCVTYSVGEVLYVRSWDYWTWRYMFTLYRRYSYIGTDKKKKRHKIWVSLNYSIRIKDDLSAVSKLFLFLIPSMQLNSSQQAISAWPRIQLSLNHLNKSSQSNSRLHIWLVMFLHLQPYTKLATVWVLCTVLWAWDRQPELNLAIQ